MIVADIGGGTTDMAVFVDGGPSPRPSSRLAAVVFMNDVAIGRKPEPGRGT